MGDTLVKKKDPIGAMYSKGGEKWTSARKSGQIREKPEIEILTAVIVL